jgi:crotonobetainyl-CoA:carnitine CoA-transferase CaiB-like acyl-CoA transferase
LCTVLALTDPPPPMDPHAQVAAWAASGAMSLTGRVDRAPLGPPAGLVARVRALGGELAAGLRALGARLDIDPLALLGERAALAGLHRRGATSVGGASRLVEAADGWMALSLARPDDVELVPAWLEREPISGDPWGQIEPTVASRAAGDLVARARLVGLPAAVLGEAANGRAPVIREPLAAAPSTSALSEVTVIELGSLWAAPLCGSLLQLAGATVVKVESTSRPDGARRGPPAFFDLLNAGKQSISLDLATPEGARALGRVVAAADVVIEASRPRALEHLGVHAHDVVARGGPRAWISITGHGRAAPGAGWVAFGDDAAVAGGLVARDGDGPVFCADAIADPIAGVTAAVAALQALAVGDRWLVDVSLSAVAAAVAGPTLAVGHAHDVSPPRARPPRGAGPRLGEHNDVVLGGIANGGSGR